MPGWTSDGVRIGCALVGLGLGAACGGPGGGEGDATGPGTSAGSGSGGGEGPSSANDTADDTGTATGATADDGSSESSRETGEPPGDGEPTPEHFRECDGAPPGAVIDAGPADYRELLLTMQPGDVLRLAPGTYDQGLPITDSNELSFCHAAHSATCAERSRRGAAASPGA